MKTYHLLLLFLGVFLFFQEPLQAEQNKINVFVSILPYAYFVEQVGDEHVEVTVFVDPGHSPETFSPTSKHIAALQNAKLFFRIGMPFEEVWMKRIQSAHLSLQWIDLREGIDLLEIGETEVNVHNHHHNHDHHYENFDTHIWLDPIRVSRQVEKIAQVLSSHDPDNQTDYLNNAKKLQEELSQLDLEIQHILKPVKKRIIALFHPSWGYFADRYGFQQIAIETEGKEPSAKQLNTVIQFIKKNKINTIFVQEQFDTRLAKTVAQYTDSQVIHIDPLKKQYSKNLKEVAQKLAEVLK